VVRCGEEQRESEIIGATSKTREPRGYPRGNVIGSWARGGPFGGVFSVRRVGERSEGGGGTRAGTTGSQPFRAGVSRARAHARVCARTRACACKRGGPKPPQSATTKTPRSLFHERPATPLDPLCLNAQASARARARVSIPLAGRKRDAARERLILARPARGSRQRNETRSSILGVRRASASCRGGENPSLTEVAVRCLA